MRYGLMFALASVVIMGSVSCSTPREITLDLGNKVSMKLVLIPAGKFLMGSPESDKGELGYAGPQREVTISKPFYMGAYEVTQQQYEQVMGKNPSRFKGERNPVEQVSWYESVAFCDALFKRTGRKISLPTEEQWEYACRAGSKTRFSYGDDNDYSRLGDYAWYASNSGGKTHPVGQKKPSGWGLYDMCGNVDEWCRDWGLRVYGDEHSVGPQFGTLAPLRGGSWDSEAKECCPAKHGEKELVERSHFHGFRIVAESE